MTTTNTTSGTVIYDTFHTITQAMAGENTTNGWDVICSYDLTPLNKMLADRYKQGTLVASIPNVPIWTWVLEFDGLQITTYDFNLDSPVLHFNLDGRATLTMPISKITSTVQGFTLTQGDAVKDPAKYQPQTWYALDGTTYTAISDQSKPAVGNYAIDNNTWYQISNIKPAKPGSTTEDKHSLVGSIPIAAITGNNQIYNTGTVVVFKDKKPNDDAHIVLHFSNKAAEPATFTITPKLGDDFNTEAQLLDSIRNYFSNEVNDIDYALNTVSPKPPKSGATMITPKAFVFATVTTGVDAKGNPQGVLSTYIETTQNRGRGQTGPIFTVQGKRSSPIPTSNTASMIFSQNFIQNVLITHSLQSSLSNCTVTFTNLSSGIQANIHSDNVEIDVNIPKTHTGSSSSASGECSSTTDYYVKVDHDVLSSQDHPITMTIAGDAASLAWNIDHAGFDYSTGSTMTVICPFYNHTSGLSWSKDTGHKITIGISSDSKSPSTLSLDSKDNVTIAPSLKFDSSTYSAAVTPKPAHKNCWEKFWTGNAASEIHSALQSALGHFAPTIQPLQFPGINYFATTNILFPDANIFEVDTAAGIKVPRDLMLLGNINNPNA